MKKLKEYVIEGVFDEEEQMKSIDKNADELNYIKIISNLDKMDLENATRKKDEDAFGNKIEKGDLLYRIKGSSISDQHYFAMAWEVMDNYTIKVAKEFKLGTKRLSRDPESEYYWKSSDNIEVKFGDPSDFIVVCKYNKINNKMLSEYQK